MRLYLVRHGKAEFGPEDANRHLSPRGRADVEAVASYLAAQEITVSRVVHSTLARARESAEILASKLAPGMVLEELEGIEPWGSIQAFAKLTEKWTEDTVVCGHEPFMGQAVSYLVTGNPHAELVEVKTGTVMALARNTHSPGWQMRWMIMPRIVRGPKRGED